MLPPLLSALCLASVSAQQYGPVQQRNNDVAAFFSSQEIRLQAWNLAWAAHNGQIQFARCLGPRREMATTGDNPRVNRNELRVGWPSTQRIAINKNFVQLASADGAGTPPPSGPPSGGDGNDPKYLIDAFLGAFFHELIHAVMQAGDMSNRVIRDAMKCQAFGAELAFYDMIKAEDPCYTENVPGGLLRRRQLCNRRQATRDLANNDHNCGFQ